MFADLMADDFHSHVVEWHGDRLPGLRLVRVNPRELPRQVDLFLGQPRHVRRGARGNGYGANWAWLPRVSPRARDHRFVAIESRRTRTDDRQAGPIRLATQHR